MSGAFMSGAFTSGAAMSITQAGFADPVGESQACFRAVLDAFARPGSIHEAGASLDPPVPLDQATAAALLTLVDGDTPLWLDEAAEAAWGWLAFHCGAVRAARADAAFGLVIGAVALEGFGAGSDDAPEDGATVVVQVAALGAGRRLRLSGPGLEHPVVFAVDGLGEGFVAAWAANHGRYPLGVDVVLCAGDRLAALPRSVVVEEA